MKLVREQAPSLVFCYLILSFSLVVGFNIFPNYENDDYTPEKNIGIFDKFKESLKKLNDYHGIIGFTGSLATVVTLWISFGGNSGDPVDKSEHSDTPIDSDMLHLLGYLQSSTQLEIVEKKLSESIDELAKTSNKIEKDFFHKNYYGQNTDMFTKQLIQKLENSEYETKDNISDVLKYVYVMNVQCDFLFYPYYEEMTRTNTKILETCTELQNKETIFTNLYPSTGTQSWVTSYGKTIDINDDGITDFILVVASDIGGISERIHESFLPGFDGKIIVEDRQEHVVVSCSDNCDNLENYPPGLITEYTQPITLSSFYLDSYSTHISKTITNNDNPLNGYTIHVYF